MNDKCTAHNGSYACDRGLNHTGEHAGKHWYAGRRWIHTFKDAYSRIVSTELA